jgi:hypothetical protein
MGEKISAENVGNREKKRRKTLLVRGCISGVRGPGNFKENGLFRR